MVLLSLESSLRDPGAWRVHENRGHDLHQPWCALGLQAAVSLEKGSSR